MFSSIRKRVKLTPSGVIAVMALVFAMSGGAYAAGKYLITSTKQIKPSVLASLKGKSGPAGANGSNGANGAAGEKGASGPQGPQGQQGQQGPEGKAGEPGKEGKAGATGTTGFTETLPAGKTETGTWTLSSTTGVARIEISFPIPLEHKAEPILEPALDETQVHYVKKGEAASASCGENQAAGFGVPVPTAAPGNLCIYETTLLGAPVEPSDLHIGDPANGRKGAGATGALFWFSTSGEAQGWGTWAVTAPEG